MDSLCFRESPAALPDDPAIIDGPDVGAMMIDARLDGGILFCYLSRRAEAESLTLYTPFR